MCIRDRDNAEYLGGMITGSDVIPYRLESDLERIFENLTYQNPEKTTEEIEIKKAEAHNFKIKEETLPGKLSPSERLNNNLEAISMLNRIERGERDLDITAQEVLARYVGWGGLALSLIHIFLKRKRKIFAILISSHRKLLPITIRIHLWTGQVRL